ncbi:NAD(P)H-dependent oxidoreductase [Candidatus Woesearchaeota archaeon]|nr:NAD(P)H-dependent oxidoreductase [Candidatus Woesearchaeota archaeon]
MITKSKKIEFLQAMNFRHACKLFDAKKSIKETDRDYILEVGRLSPSSRGLEPWDFYVLQSAEMKQKLQLACLNQPQVGTASFNVVILAKIKDLHPDSKYMEKMLERFGVNKEQKTIAYREFYGQVADVKLWCMNQCFIAAANMMTAAAFIGIDSCPIGGFEADKVKSILKLKDPEIALIVCFGYRVKEARVKNRRAFEEVVKFVD